MSSARSVFVRADHLIESGHSFREGSEILLHRENSYFKRLALEEIEIFRHRNNNDITVLNRCIPEEGLIKLIYENDSHLDDSPVRS